MKQIVCAVLVAIFLSPIPSNSNLESENTALRKQLEESQSEIHTLSKQVEDLRSQIGALESAPRKLLARAKSLQKQELYEQARLLYSNIIGLYPLESPEAREARQSLDYIDKMLEREAEEKKLEAAEQKFQEEFGRYYELEGRHQTYIEVRETIEKLPGFGIVKGIRVRLRAQPSLKGKVLGFVGKEESPDDYYDHHGGEVVVVLEKSQNQTEIDGYKDYWYRIKTISEEWRFDKEGWCYGRFLAIHHHERRQTWMLYEVRQIGSDTVKIGYGCGVTDQSPQWVTVFGTNGAAVAHLCNLVLSKGSLGRLLDPSDPSVDPSDIEYARAAGTETHPLGIYQFEEGVKDIGDPLFAMEGRHFPTDFTTISEERGTDIGNMSTAWIGPFLRLSRRSVDIPYRSIYQYCGVVLTSGDENGRTGILHCSLCDERSYAYGCHLEGR